MCGSSSPPGGTTRRRRGPSPGATGAFSFSTSIGFVRARTPGSEPARAFASLPTGYFYCQTAPEPKKYAGLSSPWPECTFLIHFLDVLFLKLLGYDGPYL